MTDKKTNPRLIPALDPEPTDEERQLAHDYLLEYTSWPFGYESRPEARLELEKWFSARRVAAARQAIEWCLCRLRDNGCYNTEMDSYGPDEYIRECLAAHDAAEKAEATESGNHGKDVKNV